jgi:hypothetical protein
MFELRKRMHHLLSQEDAFWWQLAKTRWYKDGDKNTIFSRFGYGSQKAKPHTFS